MDRPALYPIDTPRLERAGWPSLEYPASPAAGAELSIAVPGQFLYRFLSVHVRLVTDANVGARTVLVEFRNHAGERFLISGAPVEQSESATNDWVFSAWQQRAEWPMDGCVLVPLATPLLEPTSSLAVVVDGVEAGDQLSRCRVQLERFYTAGPAPGILG